MTKFREVPKNLVPFNSDDLSEDTGLIAPEILFDDFAYENLFATTLASPESLFGKSTVRKTKLKSPEELFGKLLKPGSNGNGKEHKHSNIKKDKKSGK